MKLAFLDTETTGLNPNVHEIIDFAVIVVEGDKILNTYQTKIKPQRLDQADPKALEINGFKEEDWLSAPSITEVGPRIAELLQGCTLVGHNVSFDEAILKQNLQRANVPYSIPYHKIDTVTLAFEHLKPLGLKRVSLDAIREFLGWSKEGSHTAMCDAEDAKRLFDLTWRMSTVNKIRVKIFQFLS